jgi:REP element-mobilizing transposase RayT
MVLIILTAVALLATVSMLSAGPQSRDGSATVGYFDPDAPIENLSGDLPHWRQDGVTYFVTFRLADSLPQEKLSLWQEERRRWLAAHPPPHDLATRLDYYNRFPQRLQDWLDSGYGSCILAACEPRLIVERALKHFSGQRYTLDRFAVAPNHVHVLATPLAGHALSSILHSWKSFTAHEIAKWEAAAGFGRCAPNPQSRDGSATVTQSRDGSATIWQKESFDHIVRSPASLERFRQYIEGHNKGSA